MRVADYLAKYLYAQGVTHVFELVGGMITVLLDAMHQQGDIKIVSMHHEQGAGFAAEGWARITGIPGVAMATSGPGATNLLTAIGSCYFDSVPTIFVTGQVNRHEQKGDKAIRQLGFQETDIISMVKPITKAAIQISDPTQFAQQLQEAFTLAISGRPGPVLIDIPMDVQRIDIGDPEIPKATRDLRGLPTNATRLEFLKRLGQALEKSQRPLILAGGGIRSGKAITQFRQLADLLEIPVVHSLMGVDLIDYDNKNHVGMLGSYGNRWTNLAVGESDLLLVLGSRLDVRQTGAMTEAFKTGREIFHVDIEVGETNNRVIGCETHVDDLAEFLAYAVSSVKNWHSEKAYGEWHEKIQSLTRQYPDTKEIDAGNGINPNAFMHELCRHAQEVGAFVTDVGQHQMWAAQSLKIRGDQRWLTSGGMGSMGFALPAAIGAAFALGDKPVVMIAGDGGFQCNIQELQTIVRNKLPIKIIIVNNKTHGMVRQFQDSYLGQRYQSTLWGYDAPDFIELAKAYKILTVEAKDIDSIFTSANLRLPMLIDLQVDTFLNVYPKIAFGQPIYGMEPEFKPLEMEGT
jgi:acetolactate synthase I/II/III large subunit